MNKRDRLREIQKRRSNKSYCYHAENLGEAEEDFFVEYIEELLSPWKDASKELPEEREEEGSNLTIDVILKLNTKGATVGYYDHQCKSWEHYGDHEIDTPTHWMYIPEIQGE